MTSATVSFVMQIFESPGGGKAVSAQQCGLFVWVDAETSKLVVFKAKSSVHPTVVIWASTDLDQTGNKGLLTTAHNVRPGLSVFRSLW